MYWISLLQQLGQGIYFFHYPKGFQGLVATTESSLGVMAEVKPDARLVRSSRLT